MKKDMILENIAKRLVRNGRTPVCFGAHSSSLKGALRTMLLLLTLTLGAATAWGQTTYKYYAIHNKDKGYLKQAKGAVANDGTFRSGHIHDDNGYSIWVLSSDGYLQQEMYYLNVANDAILYLSTEKVTLWTIDDTTISGKNLLKPNGSSKYLCADNGPLLRESPSNYYNACEMTITESNFATSLTDVSFTVQSPQLVTYLRTYYKRKITATILKNDKGETNQKVANNVDNRCYCSLTYSTTSDTNIGNTWNINTTTGVIYNKQASGDISVAATYSVAPLDPIVLSNHPATTAAVTLKLQPLPFAPDAEKNYLLFYTKDANYRFPYDDGDLSEDDPVKTNATKSVLTEPANDQISWKVVRDDEGFYSFRNVNSGRWLRFDESHYVTGSDYGVIEMGGNGNDTPTDAAYKFRLYKSGTLGNGSSQPTYCILPYCKQYAVFKSDGVLADALTSLNVYTTPKVISLGKAGNDSKYCIFAYEAEYRIRNDFTVTGPPSANALGTYEFTADSYYFRAIKGSATSTDAQRDLEIKDSYEVNSVDFNWTVEGLDGGYYSTTQSVSKGKGTLHLEITSLPPSGSISATIKAQAKAYTDNNDKKKYSGWKTTPFVLYPSPSPTTAEEISSLALITNPDGVYKLTDDVSDMPGVANFSGFLDGNGHHITSLSAPLFTTLTNATIRNLTIDDATISQSGSVGAIAGTADGGTVIYNVGLMNGSVSSTDGYCGGLVGLLKGTSRIINCFSYADIAGGTDVGGIVGYNNYKSKANDIKTMVMNCMFYGDITDGTTISPIYGGEIIDNQQGGLNTFNYYAYDKLKTKKISSGKYNCALAVEDKYLNRFEFYRLLLNSNKKLAAFYATGSPENGGQMFKWVLETADRTISNPKPYPVLKAQGYYPSIINPDIANAPNSATVGRNHGGKLGKTLSVSIATSKSDGGQTWPTDASITTTSLTLQRTDKDFDRFNYNYDKVQLPYYDEVGTGNYTGNRVVTGWKITNIDPIADDPYDSDNYPTTGIKDYPDHNYADRKSSNKDLYTVSGRVFSQGAYFDVPYGVNNITIEPYWGKACYIADPNYDVVYKNDYSGKQDVTQTGTQAKPGTDTFNGQKIENTVSNALTFISNATNKGGLGGYGPTVYDNAVVLVGNLHLDGVPSGGTNPFTMMSVDEDNDHEPDYSLIYHHKGRTAIAPIRFDFLNIPGTAQAQKPNTASLMCNFTIFKTKGWFETTNTSLFYTSQVEYENLDGVTKSDAPLILLGGVIDQFVSTQSKDVTGKTIYIHVGGNVWINSFGLGTHSDGSKSTPHVPVSVTGGEFPGFYLSGTYNANADIRSDNAECYISGGYFHEAAGASQEAIGGDVKWQIYDADIDNFFGGGTNDAKPIGGNVTVDIYNSHVTTYCGGPKFGNMQSGKKVTTNANGCVFGTYFGAGFGGLSYSRKKYFDATTYDFATLQKYYYNPGSSTAHENERGKYYNGTTTNAVNSQYGKKGPGVATDFDYEFFVWSSGQTGARFFVKFASFSLAQCNDVESKLKNCIVENNYYGGGSLGKVVGTVTSELDGCTVKGNVFGAGYSALLPTLEVRDAGFAKDPNDATKTLFPSFNSSSGMFEPGTFSGTTEFQWENGTFPNNGAADPKFSSGKVTTNINLEKSNLGAVDGDVNLTLKGDTTVGTLEGEEGTGNVFGGGESSYVTGATHTVTVNLQGNTEVLGNVFGGGDKGLVEGSTEVNIMQPTTTTTTP